MENGDRLRLPIWMGHKADLVLQGCAHPDVVRSRGTQGKAWTPFPNK